MTLPNEYVLNSLSISTFIFSIFPNSSSFSIKMISSSAKSSSSSTNEDAFINCSRSSSTFFDNWPSSWFLAPFNEASVLEFIISTTASAWARSILLFKNARFVNSPGSANLIPLFTKISIILLVIKGFPCVLISIESSPV